LKNALKDNLLQFVLLFAAETLGFFAENLREENAQRKLGIKLTHARVADLKRIEDKGDGKLLPILTRALKRKSAQPKYRSKNCTLIKKKRPNNSQLNFLGV
jgi:hypothetical protein